LSVEEIIIDNLSNVDGITSITHLSTSSQDSAQNSGNENLESEPYFVLSSVDDLSEDCQLSHDEDFDGQRGSQIVDDESDHQVPTGSSSASVQPLQRTLSMDDLLNLGSGPLS